MISEVLCRGMAAGSGPDLDAILAKVLLALDKVTTEYSQVSDAVASCPPSKSDDILMINDTAGKLCSAFVSNIKFTFLDENSEEIASLDSPLVFYDDILDVAKVSKDIAKILKRILAMREMTQKSVTAIDKIMTQLPTNIYAETVKTGLTKYKAFFTEIDTATTEENLKKVATEASRMLRPINEETARIGLVSIYSEALRIAKDVHTIFTNAVADPFNEHIIYYSVGNTGVLLSEKSDRQSAAKVEFGNMEAPSFYNIRLSLKDLIKDLPATLGTLPAYPVTGGAILKEFTDQISENPNIAVIKSIYDKVAEFERVLSPTPQQVSDISAAVTAIDMSEIRTFLNDSKAVISDALDAFNKDTLIKLNTLDAERITSINASLPTLQAQLKPDNEVLRGQVDAARKQIITAESYYVKTLQLLDEYGNMLDTVNITKIMQGVQRKRSAQAADIKYAKEEALKVIVPLLTSAAAAKQKVDIDMAAMVDVVDVPIRAIIQAATTQQAAFNTAHQTMIAAKAQFDAAMTTGDITQSVEAIKGQSAVIKAKSSEITTLRLQYETAKQKFDANQLTQLRADLAAAQAAEQAAQAAGGAAAAQATADVARLSAQIRQLQTDLATHTTTIARLEAAATAAAAAAAANAPTINKAANETYIKAYLTDIIPQLSTKTGKPITDISTVVSKYIGKMNSTTPFNGQIIDLSNVITPDTLKNILVKIQEDVIVAAQARGTPLAPDRKFTDAEINTIVTEYIDGAPEIVADAAATPPVVGRAAIPAHPPPTMRGGGRHRVTRRRLTGSKRRKAQRKTKINRHQ